MWRIPSLTKTRNASLAAFINSPKVGRISVCCRLQSRASCSGEALPRTPARDQHGCQKPSQRRELAVVARLARFAGRQALGPLGAVGASGGVRTLPAGRSLPATNSFPAYRSRRSGKLNRLSTRVGQSASWMFRMRPRTLARSAWTSQTIPQDLIRPALRLNCRKIIAGSISHPRSSSTSGKRG